jgi:beta-phosphoglucomutase
MKAIIFDMDGVLVDSMPYHAEAWKQAFSTVGISIEQEAIYELEGSNHRQLVDIIFRRFGRTPTEDDIRKLNSKKIEIFNSIERAVPFEGIKELLTSLKQKHKLAVVSGSNRKTVHDILNKFFPGIFDVVIDGDDSSESKPSPVPYLKAAEKLDIPMEHCLVVENAPLGIRSAKSAGLRCIAIPTYLDRRFLEEADIIVESHRELGKYIRKEEEREAQEEHR